MKTVMNCWRKEQTASEYLQHFYEVPEERPELPLADEAFVSQWQEAEGHGVLAFLAEDMGLPVFAFAWEAEEELRISFARTAGGRLPVIATGTHEDFRAMEAVLGSCEEKRELPLTVNAFTLEAKAEGIFRHRLLLHHTAVFRRKRWDSPKKNGLNALTDFVWLMSVPTMRPCVCWAA